jgi:VWFA-related protein
MKIRPFWLAAACVVAGLMFAEPDGFVAIAQSPPPTFHAGVDVVRLDVSVRDRDRRPVRGLSADDFVVLEDGRPRPVVAFSAVDIPDAGGAADGWTREVSSDVATNRSDVQRVVVIVMDDGMTEGDPAIAAAAKRIARDVIDRLSPNDLAAVVFTFGGRPQNFTRDRRQLIAATQTYVPKFSGGPPTAFSAAANPGIPMGAPLGCSIPGGTNCLMRTLEGVAAALAETPVGRKSIVLISSGVSDTLERADAIDDLRELLRGLQAANANVYPFDPAGLTPEGIVGLRFDFLRTLADHTGGRTALATNAPWEHVPQVFAENSSYYLLGIAPGDRAQDNRFRHIVVKVRRPGVEVRTRAGYYAPKGSRPRRGRPVQPTTGLDQAFNGALPSGTLPLSVSAAPFALPGEKKAELAVTLAVKRPVGDRVAVEKLDVRAAAFDESFKQRATHRESVELTLRPHALGERRVELQSRLTLAPGRYEVRVAAEAGRHAGGVFLQVEIPDFRKLPVSLSGLVLGHPGKGGAGGLSELLPVIPTVSRAFARTDSVVAFLRVYQGAARALQPIDVRASIVDAGGRTSFEESRTLGAAAFGATRAADYQLAPPLSRLGPGEYLLSVEAAGTGATMRRDVRFAVEGP